MDKVEDCLFCKIANGSVQSEFVYEDDQMVVIHDIHPEAPVHLLLIPKRHIASLDQVSEQDLAVLGNIQLVASKLARRAGIAEKGYRLVNNCGAWGGQVIMHLHYHLLGGKDFR